MRYVVLIGIKKSKPEIIDAGSNIAEQKAAYKKLVIKLSKGGSNYDSVELYSNPLRFVKKGKPKSKKEKE